MTAQAVAEIHRSSTDELLDSQRGGRADAGLHARLVEYRKPLRCRKGKVLKQYCKRVNIQSIYFIKHCIYECLDGKWGREDVHELLAQFCDWDIEDIARCAKSIKDRPQLFPVVDQMAAHIQQCLKAHRVELPRARNRLIQDGITKKKRKITIACMLQQIYDYIAKIGLQELFDAKFAPHQFATIKGRGQTFGKKFNERWMREVRQERRGGKNVSCKPASTCAIDADARKCYPTMSIGKLKAHLKRDVRNPELLWLTNTLIDKMTREKYNLRSDKLRNPRARFVSGKGLRGKRVKRGISIGSYLSCNLCNYMMSYAWHYMQEQACRWEMRKGKDGVYRRTRVRLITHCDIYMDNFTIYGKNKRDLMRAERLLEAYMRKELGMHIKCSWRLYRLAYKDKHGKEHGAPVDAMGYVVYRDRTRMRGKIFLRARRKFARLRKIKLHKKRPSKRLCGSVVAYNGWFCNSSARRWQRRNDFKYHVFTTARKEMGRYMREEVAYARLCEMQRAALAG